MKDTTHDYDSMNRPIATRPADTMKFLTKVEKLQPTKAQPMTPNTSHFTQAFATVPYSAPPATRTAPQTPAAPAMCSWFSHEKRQKIALKKHKFRAKSRIFEQDRRKKTPFRAKACAFWRPNGPLAYMARTLSLSRKYFTRRKPEAGASCASAFQRMSRKRDRSRSFGTRRSVPGSYPETWTATCSSLSSGTNGMNCSARRESNQKDMEIVPCILLSCRKREHREPCQNTPYL